MNVAVYIRTSTEEQNPKNQLRDCLSLIEDKKYELFEEKQSAWKDEVERKEFNKLKELIKKKKIQQLICWDLDRLYRNRKKLKGFFQFCKTYNCSIKSYRQKFLNEIQEIELPKGFEFVKDMMLDNFINFLGWIAEDESKKKSERVKASIRIKDGKLISYKGSKWGRPEITKRVIQEVIKLREQGLTLREISSQVHYWDKSKNKKQLSKSAVHKILKNVLFEKP